MTEYIKTATIMAEKFNSVRWENELKISQQGLTDHSKREKARRKWCRETHIYNDTKRGGYRVKTLEGALQIEDGDYLVTGVRGEHYPIAAGIFKQTYRELPVIPQTIANAIEEYRDRFGSAKGLFTLIADISAPWALGTLEIVTAIPEITLREFIDKTDVLARAWLDGYQVDTKS